MLSSLHTGNYDDTDATTMQQQQQQQEALSEVHSRRLTQQMTVRRATTPDDINVVQEADRTLQSPIIANEHNF